MKFNSFPSFLFCFLLSVICYWPKAVTGQNLDSLELLIQTDIPDSVKLSALLDLCWGYSRLTPHKTLEFNEQAMEIIRKARPFDSVTLSRINYYEGVAYKNLGEHEKALEHLNQYLSYWIRRDAPFKIGSVLYQFGVVFYNKGDFEKSMQKMLEALEKYREVNHRHSISTTLNSIANLHKKLNQLDKAEETYKEALSIKIETNDRIGQAYVYNNLGNLKSSQNKFGEALEYYKKQIEIDREEEYEIGLSYAYENVGTLYKRMEDNDKANEFYDKAIMISENLEDSLRLTTIYILKGELMIDQGRFSEAETIIKKGLNIAKAKNLPSEIESGYKAMSLLYEKRGNAPKAVEWYRSYSMMKDSLMNKDVASKMVELEAKYETAEKERAILALSAENQLKDVRNFWMSIGLAAVLLLVVLVLYFLWQRQKSNKLLQEKNRIISEALEQKNILLKEIHHRVKNNLQVISSLLNLQSSFIDDKQAAEAINEGRNRVHSMALIHQSLYQRDNLVGISVKSYFEKLISELFHTYRVDQNKVDLSIDVDDIELDVETMIPIGLVINELVTNTLKYAFEGRDSGKLSVTLKEEGGTLKLKVEDNGIGLADPEALKTSNTFGYQLIDAFMSKMEGDIDIRSENGTTVILTIRNYKLAA